MRKLVDFLAHLLIVLSGMCLILMMIQVTADVLFKYLISSPIPGTAEIVASYYMVAVVFLPLAYVELKGSSIMVELFFRHLSERLQVIFQFFSLILGFIFYFVLMIQSWEVAKESFHQQEYIHGVWKVIIWPSRFIIPLGFGVASIAVFISIVNQLIKMIRKD